MDLAKTEQIPRLIDAAERLRAARTACRQFLMLHALQTEQPYEELARDLSDPERRRRTESAHASGRPDEILLRGGVLDD